MNISKKTYLMVVNVNYYRVNETLVALEGSFIEHLKLLKEKLYPSFNCFLIAMVEMEKEIYEKDKSRLLIIDEQAEGIVVKSLCRGDLSSRTKQVCHVPSIFNRLKVWVKDCDVLHTGLSHDPFFPATFMSFVLANFFRKKIIYVVDIDFRNSALMNYKTGRWSLKNYLICKFFYDKFRELQINLAVKKGALTLLKGKSFCEDFGQGKSNAKNFLDSAYSDVHIITQEVLNQKIESIKDCNYPLDIVYFGRLTAYKGVDLCLQAVAIAQQNMNCAIKFHILGDGEDREKLKNLAQELGIQASVVFYGALPFSLEFFKTLQRYHLLLAAPLSEDTPRSALDALASGIPILAFDTYYYKDLLSTGAVDTVSWPSVEKMAKRIAFYSKNREVLATMMSKTVSFAKQNTQEKWIDRRIDWTRAYIQLV